jgi:hypothetical protein
VKAFGLEAFAGPSDDAGGEAMRGNLDAVVEVGNGSFSTDLFMGTVFSRYVSGICVFSSPDTLYLPSSAPRWALSVHSISSMQPLNFVGFGSVLKKSALG